MSKLFRIPTFLLTKLSQTSFFRKVTFVLIEWWISSWKIKISSINHNFKNYINFKNCIIAVWHTDICVAIPSFEKQDFHIMISSSNDGNWLEKMCTKRGYTVHRGSSSQNSLSGLRKMLHSVKHDNKKKKFCMTLDGPRGPLKKKKPGTEWLGHNLNCNILLMQVSTPFYFRLPTWDKTLIPLPFSRIQVKLIDFFSTFVK